MRLRGLGLRLGRSRIEVEEVGIEVGGGAGLFLEPLLPYTLLRPLDDCSSHKPSSYSHALNVRADLNQPDTRQKTRGLNGLAGDRVMLDSCVITQGKRATTNQ